MIKNILNSLKKELKFSASDPSSFEELWSFQSTSLRLVSLFLIFLMFFAALMVYLFVAGPFSGYFDQNDVSIERTQLEDQHKQISQLTEKVKSQEAYLQNLMNILEGKEPETLTADTMVVMPDIHLDSLYDKTTESEARLFNKINRDLRSARNEDAPLAIFVNPVLGRISQEFDKLRHPGIDIVTLKDAEVKACMSGTVIFSGFSRMDGYTLLIDHGNDFISVYKHNKTVFKKAGDKVQLGDPVAIVGNSGENTSGPHLHFEIWHNQKPVNPLSYVNFKD